MRKIACKSTEVYNEAGNEAGSKVDALDLDNGLLLQHPFPL
jgi:hypothetical protein